MVFFLKFLIYIPINVAITNADTENVAIAAIEKAANIYNIQIYINLSNKI